MESFLWSLIVLTVRYQIVGRRRTGALEINLARLANQIHRGEVKSEEDFWKSVFAITPTDEDFMNPQAGSKWRAIPHRQVSTRNGASCRLGMMRKGVSMVRDWRGN